MTLSIGEYNHALDLSRKIWRDGATPEIRNAARILYYSIIGSQTWKD